MAWLARADDVTPSHTLHARAWISADRLVDRHTGASPRSAPPADPETGILYVKALNSASLLALAKADPTRTEGEYDVDRDRRSLTVANGLFINKSPYGTVTAIDLNQGTHVWQVPVGDLPFVRHHPALRGVDLPPRLGVIGAPGPMVTKGGMVFLTGGGATLYAFDKTTGKELWAGELGERGYANPMTYQVGGRQFVVIATGSGESAALKVFALPAATTAAPQRR